MSQDDHGPGPSRPERGAPERFETVIIGAGQAGHIAKRIAARQPQPGLGATALGPAADVRA